METFPARRALFSVRDAYDTAGSNSLFFAAMKENCAFQYAHCPAYRAMLDGMGFSPADLCSYDDLAALPFLPTLLFKRHKLFARPKRERIVHATSSGTGGTNVSEVGFAPSDLLCGLAMVLRISKLRSLFSPLPCHYFLLGYKPHRGNRTAVTKTALGATFFAPALSRTYALTWKEGSYHADLDKLLDVLPARAGGRFPLRFMGFPSYTYFLMQKMADRGLSLRLPAGSKILLGGGWKQFYTQEVDKSVFYTLAEKTLGIADSNIIEFFGAVEHPILYCDCRNHRFHVPAYSRVIIRDPVILAPLPYGKVGLVNLLTPMVTASPLLSVMTDDLGVLHPGEACGCGLAAPTLEILGRVGLADIKTCAAGAADLLDAVEDAL